jgi:phosphonate transport system substrate-binding protein
MGDDAAELTLVTCQAHNTVSVSRAIAAYLSDRLARPVHFLEGLDWQEAYRGVAVGKIDIGWICGRPYTRLVDENHAPIRLLAAPVMAGKRYRDQPIYFSDVVVRADSRFHRFSDLRGASWAYNEPGSQSGYHVTRHHLARIGEREQFFGRVLCSGAHVRSLAMVIAGEVDASAIDSTVLEWELARHPALAEQIRVIETLGPSPIPPLVVSTRLSPAVIDNLRNSLLILHTSAVGRRLLTEGRLARFAAVEDADYDAIRKMDAAAADIALE